MTEAERHATIYTKRRCRQTVRPHFSLTITVNLGGGWGGYRFLLCRTESTTISKITNTIKYSIRTPPFGGTIEPPSLAGNRPCGRPAFDHRAAARRAVCGSAVFMIQYSTISVNQNDLFNLPAKPQGRGKSPALRLFTAYATRVPRQNMKTAPHTHIQFWHREFHCGFSA